MATKYELSAAIDNSATGRIRIEAGEPGTEDFDCGYARLTVLADNLEPGHIIVDWDSGVRTSLALPDATVRIVG